MRVPQGLRNNEKVALTAISTTSCMGHGWRLSTDGSQLPIKCKLQFSLGTVAQERTGDGKAQQTYGTAIELHF